MELNKKTELSEERKKELKTAAWIGGIFLAVVLIITFYAVNVNGINFERDFSELSSNYWCTIGRDGSYMKITASKYNDEAQQAIDDVNEELGFPEALNARMGQTRAVDGLQTEENRKIKVSWTFDGSDLEVIYEKK